MDSTTSDTPREIEGVLVDLDIIRQIPTNHKLNVSTKTYVHADSIVNASIGRWWYKETGDTTIDYINKTIDKAIAVCKKYPSWINEIASGVSFISNALLNLEKVYERENKISIVGRINFIKNRIDKDRFLRGFQESKLPDIFDIPSSKPLPIPIPTTPITSYHANCANCSKDTSPVPINEISIPTNSISIPTNIDLTKTPDPAPISK